MEATQRTRSPRNRASHKQQKTVRRHLLFSPLESRGRPRAATAGMWRQHSALEVRAIGLHTSTKKLFDVICFSAPLSQGGALAQRGQGCGGNTAHSKSAQSGFTQAAKNGSTSFAFQPP